MPLSKDAIAEIDKVVKSNQVAAEPRLWSPAHLWASFLCPPPRGSKPQTPNPQINLRHERPYFSGVARMGRQVAPDEKKPAEKKQKTEI